MFKNPFAKKEQEVKLADLEYLIQLIITNNKDGVREQLQLGFDVNTTDEGLWTPLHWAIENGRGEIVKILLEHNANIDAKDSSGVSPLLLSFSSLHKSNSFEILLQQKANPNITDKNGKPLLIHAIDNLETHWIEMLLKHKANPNIRTTTGETALMYAVKLDDHEIVRTLLKYGADITLQNPKGETVIDYAKKKLNPIIITDLATHWIKNIHIIPPKQLLKLASQSQLFSELTIGSEKLLNALNEQPYDKQIEFYKVVKNTFSPQYRKKFETMIRAKRMQKEKL